MIYKKSWTPSFTAIIKFLRLGGKIIPTNTNYFRLLSDIEIPTWSPVLLSDVKCDIDDIGDINEINGEWIYPKNINNYKKHNKYILYIHGGAFCMSKSGTYRAFLYKIAKKTNSVIFSVNYRRSPEFKYPIPLDDCVKGYEYLLEIVKKPQKIILAGDSAGGNLSIGLIAKLIGSNLDIPSKCILISPWTDLTDSGNNLSWELNKKYDFIRPELAKHFSEEYIDSSKYNLKDVSPLYLSDEILSKFPSMLIEYGECEVLHDQIEQFCKKIEKLGVNINYKCRKDMTHVFPIFYFTGISQSKDFFNSAEKFIG